MNYFQSSVLQKSSDSIPFLPAFQLNEVIQGHRMDAIMFETGQDRRADAIRPTRPPLASVPPLGAASGCRLWVPPLGARGTSPAFDPRHDTTAVAGLVPRAPREPIANSRSFAADEACANLAEMRRIASTLRDRPSPLRRLWERGASAPQELLIPDSRHLIPATSPTERSVILGIFFNVSAISRHVSITLCGKGREGISRSGGIPGHPV
jgi:hypothetical protein